MNACPTTVWEAQISTVGAWLFSFPELSLSLSWISPWKDCLQSSSRRLGKLKLLVFCQLPWAAHLLPARGNPTVRDLKLHGENIWHRSFQQLQKCRIISQRPLLLLSSDETFGAWQEYCVIKASLL